jgi:hypothetical protein
LVGHYRLADFDTPVAIVFEDQVLWIDLLSRYQATRLRLEPLSGDVLRLSSSLLGVPFTAIVVLERDISGAVSGFSMTSPRTWHLQFRRSAATST